MANRQTVEEFVGDLVAKLSANVSQQRRVKKHNVLKKLGVKRLSSSKCDEIQAVLRQHDISWRVGRQYDLDWSKIPADAPIVFAYGRTSVSSSGGPAIAPPGLPETEIQGDSRSDARHSSAGVSPSRLEQPANVANPVSSDAAFVYDVSIWWGPIADLPKGTRQRRKQVREDDTGADRLTGVRFKYRDRNHWVILRQQGDHPWPLFDHQEAAISSLTRALSTDAPRPFTGILVLPTGAGKTRTMVHWLLKNAVDQGVAILWVAHRTELLNQAALAFRNCARSDVLERRSEVTLHLISGEHNQAVRLKPDDDIVIASIASIRHGSAGEHYLVEKWLRHHARAFLIIDEAHHAPARTYRHLIDLVKKHTRPPRIVGLTATPFRTAKKEQGHIGALFPDGVIHKNDLREMIVRNILSTPEFRTSRTFVSLVAELTDADRRYLEKHQFDWLQLGQRAAETIGQHRIRNRAIVEHYTQNRETYGQTIVFALNVANAIALDALFRSRGVRSAYVISDQRDATGTRNTSAGQNRDAIQRFRNRQLDVLINVNILTEGVDLPNTQSVFLARPTTSRVLMMQMIGRGLRGTAAGGTQTTYIVSFLDDDDWHGQIEWVSPEQLFIEENVDLRDRDRETKKRVVKLISLKMLQEYARLLNEVISEAEFTALPFRKRLPIGFYSFPLVSVAGGDDERYCEILVYDGNKECFQQFLEQIQDLVGAQEYAGRLQDDAMPPDVLEEIVQRAESEFFAFADRLPGYRREDIASLIQYVHEFRVVPQLIAFADRESYDVDLFARRIHACDDSSREGHDGETRVGKINAAWEAEDSPWRAFFAGSQARFVNEVSRALQRLEFTDVFQHAEPPVELVEKDIEELTLWEMRRLAPERYRTIENSIAKRNTDGSFVCKNTKCDKGADGTIFRDANRWNFHIDHIMPRQHGGKTCQENLQLLCWRCNLEKGGKLTEQALDG